MKANDNKPEFSKLPVFYQTHSGPLRMRHDTNQTQPRLQLLICAIPQGQDVLIVCFNYRQLWDGAHTKNMLIAAVTGRVTPGDFWDLVLDGLGKVGNLVVNTATPREVQLPENKDKATDCTTSQWSVTYSSLFGWLQKQFINFKALNMYYHNMCMSIPKVSKHRRRNGNPKLQVAQLTNVQHCNAVSLSPHSHCVLHCVCDKQEAVLDDFWSTRDHYSSFKTGQAKCWFSQDRCINTFSNHNLKKITMALPDYNHHNLRNNCTYIYVHM